MENLEDALADQKEFETAISANVADSIYNFDEAELDAELEKLVEEDKKEKAGAKPEPVNVEEPQQEDKVIDELAELVGGVNIEEKDKAKERVPVAL